MNDAFLVSVFNRVADLLEQLQTLVRAQFFEPRRSFTSLMTSSATFFGHGR